MKKLDPAAEAAAHDDKKQRQKHKILGVLVITDLFEGLDIKGFKYPPVVEVVIRQHGSSEFEIESVSFPSHVNVTQELINMASMIALDKAKNTSEEFWTYELVD